MSSIGTGGWGWGWLGQDGAGLGSPYSQKVLGYSPIAYWPMNEATGTNANCLVNSAQNGTYSGVTLGQTGIGDGNTCPLFDGANDYLDVYSTAFNTAWAQTTSSISMWVKLFNVGAWSDERRALIRLSVDGDNQLDMYTNSGVLWGAITANTVVEAVSDARTDVDWMHIVMTNNEATDTLILYVDATAVDTETSATGVWSGNLSSTACVVGDKNLEGGDPWYGWLAHCAVWDSVLTPTQIADLAVV